MFLRLWDWKLKLMRVLLLFVTVFYSCLVMYSVILRYGFSETIIGIEELATYSAVWAYFVGAAYGSYERSHISASLVPVMFRSDRARAVVEVLATTITLVVGAAMTWHVYKYFSWSVGTRPRSLELETDLVWFHGAVLFGFAMMTVYTAIELADRIKLIRSGSPLAISPLREAERST